MKKQAFYKTGPLFYKDGAMSPFNDNHIEYHPGGETSPNYKPKGKACVKEGGKATGSIGDYAHFSPERTKEYDARGWKYDHTIDVKSGENISSSSPSPDITVSSGGGTDFGSFANTSFKPPTLQDPYSHFKSNWGSSSVGSDTKKVNDGIAKGLVRQAKGGKWDDSMVVDQSVGKQGDLGRAYRKVQKEISKEEGMTRRERRLQKTLGKAVAGAAAAGANVTQKDKSGKVIRTSHTPGMEDKKADYGGRARKKAARMVKRANRIASRMKSHEGSNYSKNF